MKDSNTAIVETNKLLLEQSDAYKKAEEGLESFGATGTDSTRLELDALKEQLATQQKIFEQGPQQITKPSRLVTNTSRKPVGWRKLTIGQINCHRHQRAGGCAA